MVIYDLYYTTYYCFEELFLSYRYLTQMFKDGSYNKDDKAIWIDILQYACNSIHNHEEYYNKNHVLVKYVMAMIKKSGKTKEKFTKAVMTHISGSIYGDFKVNDGKMGNCWIKSCADIVMNNKEYRCKICNSRFKKLCDKEKVNELEKNAIAILSVPISEAIV